jgi:hypothetical protein
MTPRPFVGKGHPGTTSRKTSPENRLNAARPGCSKTQKGSSRYRGEDTLDTGLAITC